MYHLSRVRRACARAHAHMHTHMQAQIHTHMHTQKGRRRDGRTDIRADINRVPLFFIPAAAFSKTGPLILHARLYLSVLQTVEIGSFGVGCFFAFTRCPPFPPFSYLSAAFGTIYLCSTYSITPTSDHITMPGSCIAAYRRLRPTSLSEGILVCTYFVKHQTTMTMAMTTTPTTTTTTTTMAKPPSPPPPTAKVPFVRVALHFFSIPTSKIWPSADLIVTDDAFSCGSETKPGKPYLVSN